MCGVSICSQWILLTKAKLWCLLSCLSKRAVEQIVGIQVSRKLITVIVCYCYVIFHSVIDDFTGHVCSETTGHQRIPVARDHWGGALMVHCAAIPSPVDSPQKGLLDAFFHVCLNELFNKQQSCK